MFPHKFDRYRMMGYIMRQLRQLDGLSQPDLGKRLAKRFPSERNRPTPLSTWQRRISHVENFGHLERAAAGAQRPLAREMFINIASEGLNLSQSQIDTLLWLIEGDDFLPLTKDELESHPLFKTAQSQSYGEEELRLKSLSLLEHAVKLARQREQPPEGAGSGAGAIAGQVRMLTGWEEAHQVKFRKELLMMEKRPGQRLLISKYPSLLVYPGDVYSHVAAKYKNLSAETQKQIQKITTKRRQVFIDTLRQYGERSIHSTESLRRYLAKKLNHPLPWMERRKHVANLITFLEKNDLFQVALSTAEPEMEFVIKSGQVASLRGTARDIMRRDSVICGPLYIFWDNKTTVFSFMVDFEHAWEKIPKELRDKENVIRELKSLVDN